MAVAGVVLGGIALGICGVTVYGTGGTGNVTGRSAAEDLSE
jgi:hypothetical protein